MKRYFLSVILVSLFIIPIAFLTSVSIEAIRYVPDALFSTWVDFILGFALMLAFLVGVLLADKFNP